MTKFRLKPITLLAFAAGLFAAFLLMALLPVSFQPIATGQAQENRVVVKSGTYQILIKGYVPTICRVSVEKDFALTAAHVTNLGQMTEFCNSKNGYIVYVDHTPDLSGAILEIDGRNVILTPSGSTAILQSSQPSRNSHSLLLDLSALPNAKGSLWFRIVPL